MQAPIRLQVTTGVEWRGLSSDSGNIGHLACLTLLRTLQPIPDKRRNLSTDEAPDRNIIGGFDAEMRDQIFDQHAKTPLQGEAGNEDEEIEGGVDTAGQPGRE